MKIITIYNKDNVKVEIVLSLKDIFFFRLQVPNISYNYRNPLTCVRLALRDLARHEMK